MTTTHPEKPRERELSPRMAKALAAYISSGGSLKAAVTASGASKSTVWQWMKTTGWRREFRRQTAAALDACALSNRALHESAVEVLRDAMEGSAEITLLQLRAASLVFARTSPSIEHARVENRIRALGEKLAALEAARESRPAVSAPARTAPRPGVQ